MKVTDLNNLKKSEPVDISMVTVYDMGTLAFADAVDGTDRFTYQNDFTIELASFETVRRQALSQKNVNMSPSQDRFKQPKTTHAVNAKSNNSESGTWNKFTERTTFHGIRYIFMHDGLHIRKVLWILFVLVAVGLFSYQVINRVMDYYEYRSNINVQVIHEGSVQFPTVTICNQNNYRISEAVNRGVYDFLDQLYAGQGNSSIPAHLRHNLTRILESSAHHLDDFIESCTWMGKPCNIGEEFSRMFTDFGICFTFNGNKSSKYNIKRTGTASGLSLVLNIESYEYMRGPHNEAGIKMLLHDEEAPMIQDLGFSVPPGTHTLVAVNRAEMKSLEHPYGYCQAGATHRTDCVLACRCEKLMELCGCADAYLISYGSNHNSSQCKSIGDFMCVMEEHSAAEDCPFCPIPCEQISYKPELSYAHLSSVSLDNIWLSNPQTQEKVSSTFRSARQTRQHANQYIASSDQEMFTAVSRVIGDFKKLFLKNMISLENNNSLESESALHNQYFTLVNTFDGIKLKYKELGQHFGEAFPPTSSIPEIRGYVSKIHSDFFGIINQTLSTLDRCVTNPNFEPIWVLMSTCSVQFDNWLSNVQRNIHGDTGCGVLCLQGRMAFAEIDDLGKAYVEKITHLYQDSLLLEEVLNGEDVNRCRASIGNFSQDLGSRIETMDTTLFKYANETTNRIKLKLAADALNIYDELVSDSKMIVVRNFSDAHPSCNWYFLSPEEQQSNVNYNMVEDLIDSVQNTLVDIQDLSQLRRQGQKLYASLATISDFIQDGMANYTNRVITKEELHRLLNSDEYTSQLDAFNNRFHSYSNTYLDYLNELIAVKTAVITIMQISYQLPMDVMRDSKVAELPLLEFHRSSNYAQKCPAPSPINWATAKGKATLMRILECMFDDYHKYLDDRLGDLKESYSMLLSAEGRLVEELETYVKGNVIDVKFLMDNYIQVDVFYKELSYERVNQQVSFPFISLLSEVGGFLGLLLGASVLTVCEVFDYLAIASLNRCRRGGNKYLTT